ncbi:hypothetical protein O181_086188 [Austropuccinia psidii MF-1]|uniref:Integrase catalytic domain-containing protein n=1 Tax=Austropuccinia psidii MF-1 TaxID=1389203 RepID=A0A9Q3IM19_9BASI|nr:hypothetical protein [Austropuccinia psidii MF-1]
MEISTEHSDLLLQQCLHEMFGHVAMKHIWSFMRQKYGDSILLNKKTNDCASCRISKSEQRSCLLPNHPKAEPMYIVSMDLMGPYSLSVNGGSCLMTARDASSTYGECHILKRKADATSLAIELMTRWERQSGCTAKVLRTDGGGEFKNDRLKKWCSAKGIVHEFSLLYFHEQNGLAEHFNRSVADIGKPSMQYRTASLMVEHLLKFYLDGALVSTAFVHIPSERCHKLDARAIQARVVAYLPD